MSQFKQLSLNNDDSPCFSETLSLSEIVDIENRGHEINLKTSDRIDVSIIRYPLILSFSLGVEAKNTFNFCDETDDLVKSIILIVAIMVLLVSATEVLVLLLTWDIRRMYQSLKYPPVSIYQPQKSPDSCSLQNKSNTEDILM